MRGDAGGDSARFVRGNAHEAETRGGLEPKPPVVTGGASAPKRSGNTTAALQDRGCSSQRRGSMEGRLAELRPAPGCLALPVRGLQRREPGLRPTTTCGCMGVTHLDVDGCRARRQAADPQARKERNDASHRPCEAWHPLLPPPPYTAPAQVPLMHASSTSLRRSPSMRKLMEMSRRNELVPQGGSRLRQPALLQNLLHLGLAASGALLHKARRLCGCL